MESKRLIEVPHGDNCLFVGMNQAAITASEESKPILYSLGAADCIILIVHLDKHKKAAMCHVTRATDIDAFLIKAKELLEVSSIPKIYACSQSLRYMTETKADVKLFNNIQASIHKVFESAISIGVSKESKIGLDTRTGRLLGPASCDLIAEQLTTEEKQQIKVDLTMARSEAACTKPAWIKKSIKPQLEKVAELMKFHRALNEAPKKISASRTSKEVFEKKTITGLKPLPLRRKSGS